MSQIDMSIRSIVIIIVVKKSYTKSHPTLPRLSLSTSTILLYPTCPCLTCLFNSTPFIPHHSTNVTIPQKSSYRLKQCPNETSKSTRLIKFYSDYPTQPQLSHFTQPFAFYPTQHTLSNSSRYAQLSKKIQTITKKEHHHQLHRLNELIELVMVMMVYTHPDISHLFH